MHRTMLDKSQVTEPAAIFFDACAECNAISRSIHRSEIAAHAKMGESRKRCKSNARVESGVEQDQRASRLLLVLTKPPFIANSIFGSKVAKRIFRMGVETYRMNLEKQGLSISRLHSHEALSRHGVHTSRVILCEEFAFVANERLCMEFEGFTHYLRDPAFQHKLAA
jgi:hypothetical protein